MTNADLSRRAASHLPALAPLALLLAASGAAADVQPSGAMLRFPDVSADSICFVYANDIWIVPKAGGVAAPLASPPGAELHPKFSPDGKAIAFVGNYDGNRDLYTLPVSGGIPTRVTYHPAGETLADWTPDGGLLFFTNGLAGLQRQTQLFTVPSSGGLPAALPLPYGAFASMSPDGAWVAYTPHSTDNRTWKRYRGGMATDIWLFNLNDKTSKRITDWEGTDTIPMWSPGDASKVYYLSDAGPEHRLNVWSYDTKAEKREQITKFADDDVRWPSIGPGKSRQGEIVFQLGGEMRLLDLGNGRDTVIKVSIPGDRPNIKPRAIDAAKNITGGSISPSGKRVAIEGRGDIWSSPAKEGVVRNLTRTDGVFERDPAWSPDGKWIAYFSDQTGEYELWLRASDAKPAEEEKKDDKKDENKDDKKDEAKSDETKPAASTVGVPKQDKRPEPKAQPRKLTDLGPGFRYSPTWSPDSKYIAFTDEAARFYLCTVETGEMRLVDTDPWGNQPSMSWSSDSRWVTYGRADEDNSQPCIWLYNVKDDKKTRVTSPMFPSDGPVFDRKGDFLYFRSARTVGSPVYSELDTSFVYTATQMLYMVPLRKDVKDPFPVKSDEEELKKDDKAKKDDKKDEKKDDKKDNGAAGEKKDGDAKNGGGAGAEAVKADDQVSGSWEGTAMGGGGDFPPAGLPFTMTLSLGADGKVSGSMTSAMGGGAVSGTFDKATGELTISLALEGGAATLTGKVENGAINGKWSHGEASGTFTGRRKAAAGAGGSGDDKKDDAKKDDKIKEVKIDLDGFERRAEALPVPAGSFGRIGVADGGKIIYARFSARGSGEGPSIRIFDPSDDAKEEKTVTAGAGGFELSADGKKLLVFRGGSGMSVMDPSAGGGKSTSVVTDGMRAEINPRNEWKQIFSDVWRLQRDFFYEPTMHGVDWPKMREHYGKMIDDCTSREDVAFVIGELISELNIGHAYVTGPGDVESAPSVGVGLLGADYELATGAGWAAYRIKAIYEGGEWDLDARGPLSEVRDKVKVGDYLLAVNNVPLDASKDPWAAFIGTAGKPTTITVSDKPTMDETARDVLVKPIGNEGSLRYRSWVERNRAYVAEKTGGKVGYIYVPNTGVQGQDELFRQFFGQRAMPALIIDERWNGGGQIPTRFIELLNRPITNYWARRNGADWPWPPDAHSGPKCMLINGLAGSGGDAFPSYFKQVGLGKLIGTRTWGGLVGISGNPGLIDGGGISVPTFGFYKKDGNWGVEGHGVDPDMEVIDDPAKMQAGGDPQLDAAIQLMLSEIEKNPYVPPKRPESPNRRGMGIPPEQR